MSEFYKQYICPINTVYSLIIEDDSNVAYAYLLNNSKIVSDVWLYNQKETPKEEDWLQNKNMPFLNSANYVKEKIDFQKIVIKSEADVRVEWIHMGDSLKQVEIHIKGFLIGILDFNSHIGFSTLVKKDGPLAKRINMNL